MVRRWERLILAGLPALNWAPVAIVSGGRVAIGDEIADALGAELCIVLIGERPGLSAADAVGLYVTFAPRAGETHRIPTAIAYPTFAPAASRSETPRIAWHGWSMRAGAFDSQASGLKEDAPDLRAIARHC